MTHLKTLFALILGLTFQLVHVHAATVPSEMSSQEMTSCECNRCCCVQNRTPQQRPAPVIANEQSQKNAAIAPAEIEPKTASISFPTAIPVAMIAPEFNRFIGYRGVGFPVAFCSFLL